MTAEQAMLEAADILARLNKISVQELKEAQKYTTLWPGFKKALGHLAKARACLYQESK